MSGGFEISSIFELASYVPPDVWVIYTNLLIVTFQIAGYSLLLYFFYKLLAKRDIFGFDVEKFTGKKKESILGRIFSFILSFIKYGFIFPIIVFLWFAAFSILLFLLYPTIELKHIILMSITFVSATRITAYVKEEIAIDIVKLIGLAFLASFIVNPAFFLQNSVISKYGEVINLLPELVKYVSFPILLEWILRILLFLKIILLGINPKRDDK